MATFEIDFTETTSGTISFEADSLEEAEKYYYAIQHGVEDVPELDWSHAPSVSSWESDPEITDLPGYTRTVENLHTNFSGVSNG